MVELLVVLVITGMTTSLLVTGLSTTWQNFDRLSNRNLTQSQGQLPKSWFIKSVNAAILGHPDKQMFVGAPDEFTFMSFMVPNDPLNRPQVITWALARGEHALKLVFYVNGKKNEVTNLKPAYSNYAFEYLINGRWVSSYVPEKGSLPAAIRLKEGAQVWVVATVHRPHEADMPPEIPLFGKYEF